MLAPFLPFFQMNVPYEGFTFLPHQLEAIQWMTARESEDAQHFRGGILADEMGLGKTWMTIGLILNEVVPNTLLLVPPALQHQWSDSLRQASIPHRILGTKKKSPSWHSVAGTTEMSVCIATYDRASNYAHCLGEFDRIVCDEGHLLRNGPKLKRFRNIMNISAARRWILSGTPVQNNIKDFENLTLFLGMNDEECHNMSPKDVASKVILRRTVGMVRENVTAMPVKPTHKVHPVVMPVGSEEETIFHALVQRLEHAVESDAKSMIILELYLRIRQFLAHPDIYVQSMRKKFKDTYVREGWTNTASKMAAFEKLLETSEKEATIVFTTFNGEMDLATLALKRAGYTVFNIRGGMTDAQREGVTVDSKKLADEGVPVALVVQIVAGGAGLNLQHCSRVIFMSSHWNPAVVDQAIARAYRMGQAKAVTVHHLLLADGAEKNVDRLMTGLHGIKRRLAIGVHDKLFCDSAADADSVLQELNDSVMPEVDT